MSEALADNIELALELVLAQPFAGANKQLLDSRLGGERCRPHVGRDRVGGYVTPSDQLLTFVRDYLINDLAAQGALGVVLRQEDVTHGVLAGLGKAYTEGFVGDLAEESMGQRHEDASAVTGVCLEAAAAAVVHA